MNLKDLEYLQAVARLASFSRAAHACAIGQPTLSTQIKKLEQTLGIPLFLRSKKKVRINQDAASIFAKADAILKLVEEIKADARQLQDPYSGTLRLAAFPTIASYVLPQYAQKIQSKFRGIQLILQEDITDTLLDRLQDGSIDCALLAEPVQVPHLESTFLFRDDFYLAVHPTHPLAKRKRVRMEQLSDEKLLLLSEGHCLREQALQVCSVANAREESFQATSMSTLIEMVKLGTGITLVPHSAIDKHDDVKFIPFQKPVPHRNIAMVWLKNSSKEALLKDLLNVLKQSEARS